MRTDFIPNRQFMALEGAASATPWGAIAQGALGLGQTIFGAIEAKKAQRKLEGHINSYKPNAGIMDYYNKALSRYSANPYTSSMYNQQVQNINRNVNAGIGALQNRRSGLAGISSLVQGQNDAYLNAAAGAERQQGAALSQLGQATQLKANEEFKPFEMRYNMYAAKAGGANKVLGAGIHNLFAAGGAYGNQMLANQMYGGGKEAKAGSYGGAGAEAFG